MTISADNELRLYRHLSEMTAYLREARDATAALRWALRAAQEFFEATDACLAVLPPGAATAEVLFVLPYGGTWDRDLLTAFFRGEKPSIPDTILLARIKRRERPWGVVALRRSDRPFEDSALGAFARIAAEISDQIQRIDRERLVEVRARIDGKVVQQVPPKDLFYQILDGIRSLTAYDHSSALLIYEPEMSVLRLVAEQIAWSKTKSRKIGLKLAVDGAVADAMRVETVYGFNRDGQDWRDWPQQAAAPLARLIDYNDDGAAPEAEPREGAILCAPLVTRDGPVGLLKVAALHPKSFGPYEAKLLQGFVPIASVAIQNSQRTQDLQEQVLEAVRKHAIVDLARGVSHDINNALGAVLPLVQQMHEEARSGRLPQDGFADDLDSIENSLQVCRRIFGGMLSFARSSARTDGRGDIRRAVDGTRNVLGDSIARRGVALEIDVPHGLCAVRGGQGNLEQLLLNLVTNARDATHEGGRIGVTAREVGDLLSIVIDDTGCGIPPESLARIHEPFFTTKPHGTGLGLSTCRWIVWEMRGQLKIDSEPGRGTRVELLLPAADAASAAGGAAHTEGGMS